jgi:hypothetical protein
MVLGSGASSNITFETNAGSERMRITSGGNLLFAGTTAGTGNSIALRGDNGGASGYAYLQVSGNGSATEAMYLYNSSGLVGSIGTNSTSLTFSTGITERMRIQSDGNVRINFNPGGGQLFFQDTTNGATMFYVIPATYVGSAPYNVNKLIAANSSHIGFETGGSERMRITSGGLFKFQNSGSSYESSTSGVNEFNTAANDTNVVFRNTASSLTGQRAGVDVYYPNASPNSSTAAFYQGADFSGGSRTLRFQVKSNGGIDNYTANNSPLSDERLKKDITPLESVWNKVKGIEIVKYKFKDQTHDDFNMGVIAQQLETVAPELVNPDGWGTLAEDGTTYKGIWENDLHYYSIKALQEAMAKIEMLEAEIEQLKNK